MANDANDIKRLNYFTGQFLEAQDFQDEQQYHIAMRRRLNRLLYSPGVVDNGFEVTKADGNGNSIRIGTGYAIDADGQELFMLAPQDKDIIDSKANAIVYVALRYTEAALDTDKRTSTSDKETFSGVIRTTEKPDILLLTNLPSGDQIGLVIPIAKVQLDGSGNIQPPIDLSVRQMANVKVGGKLGIGTIDPNSTLSVAGGLAVGATYATTNAAPANGLLVEGNVGIGTSNPLGIGNLAAAWKGFHSVSDTDYALGIIESKKCARLHLRVTDNTQDTTQDFSIENFNNSLKFDWLGGTLNTRINVLAIDGEGKVGVNTSDPKSHLSVAGGLAVGATYANTNAAPTNGLLVEGNVGIGVQNPEFKLEVDGTVRATTFIASNPMQHRMYPEDPKVYQQIFDPYGSGIISILPTSTNYDATPPTEHNEWYFFNIIKFGQGTDDNSGAKVNIPQGYDTVWVRCLGERWTGMKAKFADGDLEDLGFWAGGGHAGNCYCPDGTLTDGIVGSYTPDHARLTAHQWIPIPAGRAGTLNLTTYSMNQNNPAQEDIQAFSLSGLAFSKNPWRHVAVHPLAFTWDGDGCRVCSPRMSWQGDDPWKSWNGDVLFAFGIATYQEYNFVMPVLPSNRDKLFYMIEHNDNWNGCYISEVTVDGQSVGRFLATYDNPFARHWNSKSFERYIAVRIPAALVGTKQELKIKLTVIDRVYIRELGTHDLDVPVVDF